METKTCVRCKRTLPLSEFNKRTKSNDGYCYICKECNKRDCRKTYYKKRNDPEWVEKERARGREKYQRLGYRNRPTKDKTRLLCDCYTYIRRELIKRGYGKDIEAHHWNYNYLFLVFPITRKAHRSIHRFITVNYTDKCCYTKDGVKLETPEQAKQVFTDILTRLGINEELKLEDLSK